MSDTAIKIDPKVDLRDTVRNLGALYVADLKHIPEDKLGQVPMGAARTALEFTAEVAGFNALVAKMLRGEEASQTMEEHYTPSATVANYAECKEAIEKTTAELAAAIDALDEDGLLKPLTTPWGAPTTAYGIAKMAASHMMYHDGQINYIQSLFGDDTNHWAG
jgi:hypothetical protein